jgi:hypothetical protein
MISDERNALFWKTKQENACGMQEMRPPCFQHHDIHLRRLRLRQERQDTRLRVEAQDAPAKKEAVIFSNVFFLG